MISPKSKCLLALVLCFVLSSTLAELNIVSKSDWEGQDSDGDIDNLNLPVSKVIISHTASEACSDRSSCDSRVRIIQKIQMESLGFSDIAYNFLIGDDGNVYEGRGWSKVGAHTRGYNSASIGIAFIGTFNKRSPSEAALNAGQELIAEGVRLGNIAQDYKLFGHRQFSSTESPGDSLYSIIKKWPQWSRRIR